MQFYQIECYNILTEMLYNTNKKSEREVSEQ